MQTLEVTVSDAGEDVEQQEHSCIARGGEIVHPPWKTASKLGIFVTGFNSCAFGIHVQKACT